MKTHAVVLEQPERIRLNHIALTEPGDADVVVDLEFSGISTGTEKLLFTGQMPSFPGMGYPLVPGYESVGRVVKAGPAARHQIGDRVFVPGARCYGEVRGLFGGAASRLVVADDKVFSVDEALGAEAVLLALAATAYHTVACGGEQEPCALPDLIVGHGVLGRLLARMVVAAGHPAPVVWEINAGRMGGAVGYDVIAPNDDPKRDYRAIYDVSGDCGILDKAISRLSHGGEVVLAGFYSQPLSFNFAPAFMREARIRAAAEWKRPDMLAVKELVESGRLSLDGLLTHHDVPTHASDAYRTAFCDAGCLKMILDWRTMQ
jgi:3-hydroxyethyl bacteriochlorophyllide a dehydrogenase